jgi:hypothetical protein
VGTARLHRSLPSVVARYYRQGGYLHVYIRP